MGVRRMAKNQVWRESPLKCTLRVAVSVARARVLGLTKPVVPYDDGRSFIVADLRTANGLALYRYGIDDPELDLVRMLLRTDDVFVDAGANIGLFSLVAGARVGPSGHVYSFEPVPTTAAALIANIRVNGYGWIELIQAGLAEHGGTEVLVAFDGAKSGFSSFAPADPGGGMSLEIPIVTLEEAIRSSDWDRVRLVKVDVEGAELRVLRGADAILRRIGPHMLIEVEPAHLLRQGASAGDVEEYLSVLGYCGYTVHRLGRTGVILRAYKSSGIGVRSSPNVLFTRSLGDIVASGVVVE